MSDELCTRYFSPDLRHLFSLNHVCSNRLIPEHEPEISTALGQEGLTIIPV